MHKTHSTGTWTGCLLPFCVWNVSCGYQENFRNTGDMKTKIDLTLSFSSQLNCSLGAETEEIHFNQPSQLDNPSKQKRGLLMYFTLNSTGFKISDINTELFNLRKFNFYIVKYEKEIFCCCCFAFLVSSLQ